MTTAFSACGNVKKCLLSRFPNTSLLCVIELCLYPNEELFGVPVEQGPQIWYTRVVTSVTVQGGLNDEPAVTLKLTNASSCFEYAFFAPDAG